MSFEELLKQAGLEEYSQYFSQDSGNIASALGLQGSQATQFGQFFQPFNQERLLEAQGAIEQNKATRTKFLEGNYQSSFTGLGQQLGQATQQIGQVAGQAGFSGAGSTAKQIAESRKMAGQSLQDLMLQNYLQGTFGRGERLYGLDPTNMPFDPRPGGNTQNTPIDTSGQIS